MFTIFSLIAQATGHILAGVHVNGLLQVIPVRIVETADFYIIGITDSCRYMDFSG